MKQLLLTLIFLTASGSALALEEINTTYFGNLAIEGYDAVAFFTEQRAIEGSREHEMNWKDANWRFSSAANLAAFQADPERYAPQYGGYCAWAVSQNDTASIDPEQFTVHAGKLYLNYNKKISTRWKADKDAFINDADRYWPQLLQN
ncbi:MAG: YHS domain protein [SAR86 cluster bacterium]|uniref:YHS domain protein n=1 Tax=SAR86 cluster bacterium TaxID=2030880 RepID=A0A2A4XDN6_9GAMM|nr:MAG: YHS domain protein [SAR86 cluster bacterium]